ncbi:hypothetical protein [Dyadobacter sp. CY323]|uniref:hypothetical protein n=1 Tax=Dyadobacter sp. CY323 TaxID=2907302 RepID=UPI001F25C0F6|nr:hypothetical protein [Dyadobacter sp. CY323]
MWNGFFVDTRNFSKRHGGCFSKYDQPSQNGKERDCQGTGIRTGKITGAAKRRRVMLSNDRDAVTMAKFLLENSEEIIQMGNTYMRRWMDTIERQKYEMEQFKENMKAIKPTDHGAPLLLNFW